MDTKEVTSQNRQGEGFATFLMRPLEWITDKIGFRKKRLIQKNATPHQVAVLGTLILGGWLLCVLVVTNLLGFTHIGWMDIFEVVFIAIIGAYFINIFALKNYIYRKIKLIYKRIHKLKLESKEKQSEININKDIIGEVEKEVSDWADSQIKEIEQLKALEAYRRNFLGDISHELKTPIFNIQGYIHTLLEGGLADGEINLKYLRKAANNAERLQTIVDDLDIISKLESGRQVLEMQNFDIRKLAIEVFEDLEIKALRKGINFTLKEGAKDPFIVRADRENIRQVLTNLVINSIKYGKQDGQTKIGFYDMDSYVLVEVADNGIGIAKEHLNRIFDRFYRVDKSRSRSVMDGGSGLGLSIVKHIIEAHRQTINVRSTPRYGSTFGFTLEKVG